MSLIAFNNPSEFVAHAVQTAHGSHAIDTGLSNLVLGTAADVAARVAQDPEATKGIWIWMELPQAVLLLGTSNFESYFITISNFDVADAVTEDDFDRLAKLVQDQNVTFNSTFGPPVLVFGLLKARSKLQPEQLVIRDENFMLGELGVATKASLTAVRTDRTLSESYRVFDLCKLPENIQGDAIESLIECFVGFFTPMGMDKELAITIGRKNLNDVLYRANLPRNSRDPKCVYPRGESGKGGGGGPCTTGV